MNMKKSIRKQFLEYVSMNVLGMFGLSLYILADTFFISNGVGIRGLAALNLAIPVFNLIYALGLMCGMGGSTRYAILKGEGQTGKSEDIFTQAFYAAALFSFLLVLCGIFLSGQIAVLLGADNMVFTMTKTYLVTILCFSPMFCANHLLTCFIRNDGAPKLAMLAMIAGSFSNIVFDYLFIYPLHMGMFGAALATGASPVVGILILSKHFLKGNHQFGLKKQTPSIKVIIDLLKLGFSSFINEISSGIVIFAFNNIILNQAGNVGVAAYGVVANAALVVSAVFTGIGQGIQPLISRFFGGREQNNMKKIFHMAMSTAFLTALLSYLVIYIWNDGIVRIFNSERNTEMAAIASHGLLLYFTGFFFCGINIVAAFYFSAASQAGKAFWISITRGLIAILIFAGLLSCFFGMTGVWLAFPSAEIFTAALSLVWYKRESAQWQ